MIQSRFIIILLTLFILQGCAFTRFAGESEQKPPSEKKFADAKKAMRYAVTGRSKRAIEHFSKSLENQDLSPHQKAVLLNNRGVAYKNAGDYVRAQEDFTDALSLHGEKPTRTWHNRAIVRFLQGDFLGAADDFAVFVNMPEAHASPYPYLWHYIALERAGLDGRKTLVKEVERLKKMHWPGVVAPFMLSGEGKEALLDHVTVVDREQSKENRCDAYFFLGEQALLAGKRAEAVKWFQKVLATGMEHLNEYRGARMELDLLVEDHDNQANPDGSK